MREALDMHDWSEDMQEEPCGVGGCAAKHGLKCAACGIRRAVGAEPGCYHFFFYDHPEPVGACEFVPPCVRPPALDVGEIVDLVLCARCRHPVGENGACPYGHGAGPIVVRTCIRK